MKKMDGIRTLVLAALVLACVAGASVGLVSEWYFDAGVQDKWVIL